MLFSTPMVVALSNGSKTMTRRPQGLELVNDDPEQWVFNFFLDKTSKIEKVIKGSKVVTAGPMAVVFKNTIKKQWAECKAKLCVGDVIWVRETFFDTSKVAKAELFREGERYLYKADEVFIGCHKWKPSIHMPKEACRLWLKVKAVRVERLNAISEVDAEKEGVEKDFSTFYDSNRPYTFLDYNSPRVEIRRGKKHKITRALFRYATDSFKSLWQKINGLESWEKNPWVWVYEFEKVERPEGW